MATQSFRELEQVGWSRKAAQYDDYLARITGQAIDPILDTLDVKKGLVLLDVCCGTGALTYAAARRGCAATGIDFATEMVAQASRNYPGLAFREGDATALDFEDASFDVVACSFGILHFDEPERAIDETLRVLRPGGRYGFTAWSPNGDFIVLVMTAIKTFGQLDVPLPPAPAIFRFADRAECRRVLEQSGFTEVASEELPLVWRCQSPEDILAMTYKSFVRIPMLLEAQTAADRARIHRAILDGAQRYKAGSEIELRFPALLVTATKPQG